MRHSEPWGKWNPAMKAQVISAIKRRESPQSTAPRHTSLYVSRDRREDAAVCRDAFADYPSAAQPVHYPRHESEFQFQGRQAESILAKEGLPTSFHCGYFAA
jgi:hypothetical protein